MQLTLGIVAKLCEGKLSEDSNPELMITNTVIDSRMVTIGSIFVAISGENSDGHLYVKNVINNGHASIVNNNYSLKLANLVYVEDTVKALGRFAHNYRKMFNIPIIAITGSNGKTTVKEMVKSICDMHYGVEHVLATSGNFNNHLGMPLTLLKLNHKHRVAIIEMGMNHSGELDYLSKLAQPTIAIINNVMLAHAGFFNDLADIAKAKGEIYNGLTNTGVACINQNSLFFTMWYEQVSKLGIKVLEYGNADSYCYLKQTGIGGKMVLGSKEGDIECTLQVLGEHNKTNAVTATTLALAIGCSIKNIETGLNRYTAYKGRLESKQAFNGALIIDDSYNANPDSVKAAILAIRDLPRPHWFIFADLKELGKFSQEAHQEIAQFAFANDIDLLLTVGILSKITHDEFAGEKLHFKTNQDIVEYCKQYLPQKATLLVKGSQSMALSEVIAGLVRK